MAQPESWSRQFESRLLVPKRLIPRLEGGKANAMAVVGTCNDNRWS